MIFILSFMFLGKGLDKVSLCSLLRASTHCNPPSSASHKLKFQVCITTASILILSWVQYYAFDFKTGMFLWVWGFFSMSGKHIRYFMKLKNERLGKQQCSSVLKNHWFHSEKSVFIYRISWEHNCYCNNFIIVKINYLLGSWTNFSR